MDGKKSAVTSWLEAAPSWVFVTVASLAGFSTYFCMYAFRKPFTAATFEGSRFLGTQVELKTALVISQLLGYVLSKYVGIKICSEARPERRRAVLILLIIWAEIALVLFAVLPPDARVVAIFLNGFPLGMVWGLVVWHLEGRRTSEILLAALSCSFIVSSGAVKDVGRFLMANLQVSEAWMPAATGAAFFPLFLFSAWLLSRLPQPDRTDCAERSERRPMNAALRWSFMRTYLLGMVLLCTVYFFLTAYRDYRDNFQREIFDALGYGSVPAIFSMTELPIGLAVMLAMVALNCVRENRRGLASVFAVMIVGLAIMGAGTIAFDQRRISGLVWMALVGLGSYLAYVPFNSVLFDRLLATTRHAGTAVFAIYVADATGYTGAILLQLYKDVFRAKMARFDFFHDYTYFMSATGIAMLAAAGVYFLRRRVHPASSHVVSSAEVAAELQIVSEAWNTVSRRREAALALQSRPSPKQPIRESAEIP